MKILPIISAIGKTLPQPIRNKIGPIYGQILEYFLPVYLVENTSDPSLVKAFNETGILFVHIPKTAGSSIREFIYGRKSTLRTIKSTKRLHPVEFDSWTKIAVIREPVDRFLSAFDFLLTPGQNPWDRRFARRRMRHQSVDSFVAKMVRSKRFCKAVKSYFHFRPQVDYISIDGRIMVNRLFPFDHVADDLPAFLNRLEPLPHLNRTTGRRTLRSSLSPEVIAAIEGLYVDDCSLYRLAMSRPQDVFGDSLKL